VHSKVYKCKFLFDVNFAPNYIKKLKLVEMEIITLCVDFIDSEDSNVV
jgi:hypothetical protein